MQQSSSFLFCSFFGCFLAKQEQRTARTCTSSWNWSAESKAQVYCRAGAAHHCRSRLFARESSKYLLFVEAKVQSWTWASRHCQSAVDMNPERTDWPLNHTLSLFCFCGLVTSKMSHGVNKSCIKDWWWRWRRNVSFSLSLHLYLSSPPLHFLLTLTFGL